MNRRAGGFTSASPWISAATLAMMIALSSMPQALGLEEPGADWPIEHAGPAATRTTTSAIPTFVEEAWRANVTGRPTAPVAGNASIFVATADGEVAAFDSTTGETRWRRILPEAVVVAPGYAQGILVVAVESGKVYGLRAGDGAPIWTTPTDVSPTAPLIYQGAVYLGTGGESGLFSLDLQTGDARWRAPLGGPPAGTPSAEGILVTVVRQDGTVLAYGADAGAFVWQERIVASAKASAPISAKKVFVTGSVRLIVAHNALNGTMAWFFDTGGQDAFYGPPAVANDLLYVASAVPRAGQLHALYSKNGTEKWQVELEALPATAAVTDGTTLVFGTVEPRVVAYDAATGERLWRLNVPSRPTAPIAAYGHVYVSTELGDIYALRTATLNKPPQVTIEFPIQGDTVTGVVDVIGRASDPDSPTQVRFVEWRVDSGLWRRANGTVTWLAKWDTVTISQDVHVLQARSSDGNLLSEPVNVTIFVSQGGGGRIPVPMPVVLVAAALAAAVIGRRRD